MWPCFGSIPFSRPGVIAVWRKSISTYLDHSAVSRWQSCSMHSGGQAQERRNGRWNPTVLHLCYKHEYVHVYRFVSSPCHMLYERPQRSSSSNQAPEAQRKPALVTHTQASPKATQKHDPSRTRPCTASMEQPVSRGARTGFHRHAVLIPSLFYSNNSSAVDELPCTFRTTGPRSPSNNSMWRLRAFNSTPLKAMQTSSKRASLPLDLENRPTVRGGSTAWVLRSHF